ncbi:MAG: YtcA family lipoprotein [Myxococcota bacterium]|nr:YtcA family lipoprotein [Myxococcota bacterium]
MSRFSSTDTAMCLALLLVGAGQLACDPVLDVDGAFFPAWMLCMILGIALTFAFYPLFVRLGIEAYVGPPVLIYPSLALFLTLLIWWIFFRT